MTNPRYKHDCEACKFLGWDFHYDLYYCDQGGKADTVIARYSSYGPDYYSGLTWDISPIQTAIVMAKKRGYLGKIYDRVGGDSE